MRIGLIAALRRSADGGLRAEMPLAGRSVLAWQADLLQSLGAERILCLTEAPTAAVLQLQQAVEGNGASFHVLKGFAALPALVRAEDDLIIVRDGLVTDSAAVQGVLGGGESPLQRLVAAIPAEHPLAAAFPEDFERIDAARHWAGVLAMRGAGVQQLADFPDDADAVSVLLRLALQAGTPCRDLTEGALLPETWLLADSAAAVADAEQALIADAAAAADWRAPTTALAGLAVRAIAPRGLARGALAAGGLAAALLLGGVMAAAFGVAAAGLALAGAGAFAARFAAAYRALAARLLRAANPRRGETALTAAVDGMAGLTTWFALAPWPAWQPLAVLGPLVIGLARLRAARPDAPLGVTASDRSGLLLALSIAAAFGVLPEVIACLALGLLAALLLRSEQL